MTKLHPILALFLETLPRVFEDDGQGGLLVVDRDRFRAVAPGEVDVPTDRRDLRVFDMRTGKMVEDEDLEELDEQDRLELAKRRPGHGWTSTPPYLMDARVPGKWDQAEHDPWYAVPEPPKCRRCQEHEVTHASHLCTECKEVERREAIAARNPQSAAPVAPVAPVKTPAARAVPTPAEVLAPAERPKLAQQPQGEPEPDEIVDEALIDQLMERLQGRQGSPEPVQVDLTAVEPPRRTPEGRLIRLGGWREGMDRVVMPADGPSLLTACREGIPASIEVSLHSNVLAMFGIDEDLLSSALRNPHRVELDATFKERNFPVLRLIRGDLYAVVGFRNPQAPMVIGVYVMGTEEGRVGHIELNRGGGGGTRKVSGRPKNINQLRTRIGLLGVEIGPPQGEKEMCEVTFEGQSLGKVQFGGVRNPSDCGSDYDRVMRKVDAIRRRVNA